MINKTFFKYIFKMQLMSVIFISSAVFCLILLFDFAEMARKYPISTLAEACFALKLACLRSPYTLCEVMHYVYFIAATANLWSLCASHQLTVLKSTGQSPKQILKPFLIFATLLGACWLFVFHPLGLTAKRHYDCIINHSQYVDTNSNIWINNVEKKQVIFVNDIHQNLLSQLCIFSTENNDKLIAQSACVENSTWRLNNVTEIKNGDTYQHDQLTITRELISKDLVNMVAKHPKQHNVYSLSNVYDIEESTGASLQLYRLELHRLLANSASFIIFVLLAAVICFPINRYKAKTGVAIKVIFFSLLLRVCNNMCESFAYTEVISVGLACWATLLILLSLSIATLIWKEA